MSNKVFVGNVEPVTQNVESVVELLNFLGKSSQPLPDMVPLANSAQLTKSSKGDCYYYTSAKSCTCPGFFYRNSCKHVKSIASSSSKPRGQTIAETLEDHDKNLWKMPASYRRVVKLAREQAEAEDDPDSLIKRGGFKPTYPGEGV